MLTDEAKDPMNPVSSNGPSVNGVGWDSGQLENLCLVPMDGLDDEECASQIVLTNCARRWFKPLPKLSVSSCSRLCPVPLIGPERLASDDDTEILWSNVF